MDQIHTPERLENETQAQYRSRRRIAKLVANRARVIARPGDKVEAPKYKRDDRLLSKHLGHRQAKKAKRLVAAIKRERAAEEKRVVTGHSIIDDVAKEAVKSYWGPAAHFPVNEGLTCTVSAP